MANSRDVNLIHMLFSLLTIHIIIRSSREAHENFTDNLCRSRPVLAEAPDMNGDKRKARVVMATDSEWQIIGERAETARMSISGFIVERAIAATEREPDDGLPIELCRRVARDILILSRVEELRYRQVGEAGAWEEIVAAAEATVKAEETADR